MIPCPACPRLLPGPASARLHYAATHSDEAIAKARQATQDKGTR